MGLDVAVGFLAELQESDPEGAADFRAELDRLADYLASARLPAHREPLELPSWSAQMWGYSGVHYLRRIGAHLALGEGLPAPGDDAAAEDPVLRRYYERAGSSPGGLLGLFRRRRPPGPFDHLTLHSDAEGYYLPVDFREVLFPDERWRIPGGMVGSSQRLHDECRRIAEALALPADLDPESPEVWEAADAQGEGEGWRRYGVESFCCLRLLHAAELSVRHGALILFC